MPDFDADQLRAFLKALAGLVDEHGKPNHFGQLFLTNLLDCLETPAGQNEPLVPKDKARDFLRDCLTKFQAGAGPETAIDEVAKALRNDDPLQFRYLRLCKQPEFKTGALLSNVVTYKSFVRHHCTDEPSHMQERVPPTVPPTAPSDFDEVKDTILKITRRPDWFRAEATLGVSLPAPINCWINVDDFTDAERPDDYDGKETPADRARDALGLINHEPGTRLIRYTFSARNCSTVDVARPTFADGGNLRFLVTHTCDRSRKMAAEGWGCAVDLARIGKPQLQPSSGRPERVTAPLKLHALADLTVEYLDITKLSRGQSLGTDDDQAFLEIALRKRTPEWIQERILEHVLAGAE